VRIICSGLACLSQTLSSGAFHRELYYRLNTLYVNIPPLRERRDEVDPLLRYFVDLAAREQGLPSPAFSSEWPAMFDGYDWPGNVRELRSVAESIVARAGYMADVPFARVH
jgi:DNA-binding NtrC family response regulator